MTTCSPGFSIGFARTCLQAGIPVKVASVWLWRKRIGEAMEKPAFANALLGKVAAVADAPLPAVAEKQACDRTVLRDLSEAIADIDKKAAVAAPAQRVELMLVRDNFQRRLNAYVMGE